MNLPKIFRSEQASANLTYGLSFAGLALLAVVAGADQSPAQGWSQLQGGNQQAPVTIDSQTTVMLQTICWADGMDCEQWAVASWTAPDSWKSCQDAAAKMPSIPEGSIDCIQAGPIPTEVLATEVLPAAPTAIQAIQVN